MSNRASRRPINPWQLADDQDEGAMWLAWLVRLRWLAIIAQFITLSFTFMVLDQPTVVLPILVASMVGLVVANLYSLRLLHARSQIPQEWLLMELLLDILVLTVFFLCSGGASNPFVILYVVHTAMAAVMMRNAYAIGVMALVSGVNVALHAWHLPLHLDRHSVNESMLMGFGQTTAFTVTVISVGMFVMGMSSTLRRQKHRLLEARDRTARTDRLRAVGTLAAGAAHELNTPLSTIGLRLRRVQRRHTDDDTVKDTTTIRTQLDRCQQIVDNLLFGAGDPTASGLKRTTLQELVVSTVKMWGHGATVAVRVDAAPDDIPVELPPIAFAQALINLLENAREAQEEANNFDPIDITVRREPGLGMITITDHGAGLPEEPDRVGEPFFTTKPTGTGLGVFVARSVAEGAGGGLRYERVSGATLTRWWFAEQERST